MHELSIAASLVDVAERTAREHGSTAVTRVHVAVGTLTSIEPDALAFSFPVAARGTLCEGAELVIERRPARGTCTDCGHAGEVDDLLRPCAACGSWPLQIEGGQDLALTSLEVD